jgi:hypothetical protein
MTERRMILCGLIAFYAAGVVVAVINPRLTAASAAASAAATGLTGILVKSPDSER